MLFRRLLVTLAVLMAPCAVAQFGAANQTGNVHVRIVFSDGRRCTLHVHVILMAQASTSPVAESFTNDECMTEFDNLMVGSYHMVVSGEGIQDADSGLFEVDQRKASQYVYITVKRVGEGEPANRADTPTVAAADLNIPDRARREYEKAAGPLNKGDWNKAKAQILKALAIYPQYAAAYNDLGVVYARLGDRVREREALQKAVSLNNHFAAAYVNLGKMAIVDRNFPDAEDFLNKATSAEPNNPQTLMLLANVELLNFHFDEAISNCHKVHALPHSSQTLVHYIAARALLHENRPAEALVELQTFLTEEPSGPRADAARAEISRLQGQEVAQGK